MVDFEVRVTDKTDTEKIIGADVIAYDDTENVLKKITVVDENGLEKLREKLDDIDSTYATYETLTEMLENEDNSVTINATSLKGKTLGDLALNVHSHDYAPIPHVDTNGMYGKSSNKQYGHVKTVDSLTDIDINDKSLVASAVATAELENQIEDLQKNNLRIKFGRYKDHEMEGWAYVEINRGDYIYAKLYCDDPDVDLSNIAVNFYGSPATNYKWYQVKTDANGEAKLQINWDALPEWYTNPKTKQVYMIFVKVSETADFYEKTSFVPVRVC